jgi:hypothetical protein
MTLMDPTPPALGERLQAVEAQATIEAIGLQLIDGDGPLAVIGAEGKPIGRLDRRKALMVLAGQKPL